MVPYALKRSVTASLDTADRAGGPWGSGSTFRSRCDLAGVGRSSEKPKLGDGDECLIRALLEAT